MGRERLQNFKQQPMKSGIDRTIILDSLGQLLRGFVPLGSPRQPPGTEVLGPGPVEGNILL